MSTSEFPQHSLFKSFLLHVLPGAITTVAFLVLKPILDGSGYPPLLALVTFTLQLILTGLTLPWVEELYFRGYLLPRLSRYGKWASLLGGTSASASPCTCLPTPWCG